MTAAILTLILGFIAGRAVGEDQIDAIYEGDPRPLWLPWATLSALIAVTVLTGWVI